MVKVDISGDSRYPADRKTIKKAVIDALLRSKIDNLDCEVSVFIVGGRKMKELAKKYLGEDSIHEVLAFAQEEASMDTSRGFINSPGDVLVLGDVVLCWPQLIVEASRCDVMVGEELYALISHGVEHLLGKHHE